MSELGNRIRTLRGQLPQPEFAKKAGLSLRTVCKLEAGDSVRLSTVQQVARAYRLSEPDRLELVISWLRMELGEDFRKLSVELKSGSPIEMRDSENLLGKIQVQLQDVPRKYQEQVYLALQRPEVLRCLQTLNELFDSLTEKKK